MAGMEPASFHCSPQHLKETEYKNVIPAVSGWARSRGQPWPCQTLLGTLVAQVQAGGETSAFPELRRC